MCPSPLILKIYLFVVKLHGNTKFFWFFDPLLCIAINHEFHLNPKWEFGEEIFYIKKYVKNLQGMYQTIFCLPRAGDGICEVIVPDTASIAGASIANILAYYCAGKHSKYSGVLLCWEAYPQTTGFTSTPARCPDNAHCTFLKTVKNFFHVKHFCKIQLSILFCVLNANCQFSNWGWTFGSFKMFSK